MYNAYITRIKNLRKHSNADRLMVGECFGNNVIVGLDTKENELGVYFAVDGKLSIDYATVNNLLRRKDDAGNEVGGYLDPIKRNIQALRLRGEKSDGLFMPLTSLVKFTDVSKLKEGEFFNSLNGKLICEKYVPVVKIKSITNNVNKTKKKKVSLFPDFQEHKDTEQLMYNLNNFKKGDTIYITLKMHGTSQRTGNLPRIQTFWNRLFRRPVKYDYVTGTRRVVLEAFNKATSFYGTDLFRKTHHDNFIGKLHKGETVYYEVLGYTDSGALIMPEVQNAKTKDKEFVKQYGETTKFTYGNEFGQSSIYIYRMTYTTPDGLVIEYPTEQVKRRAEEMGVPFVPVFAKFIFTGKKSLMNIVNKYANGRDPVGKTHIREGVVIRVDNSHTFKAYKHKNFNFKVLEGIAKVEAEAPDMEEAQ